MMTVVCNRISNFRADSKGATDEIRHIIMILQSQLETFWRTSFQGYKRAIDQLHHIRKSMRSCNQRREQKVLGPTGVHHDGGSEDRGSSRPKTQCCPYNCFRTMRQSANMTCHCDCILGTEYTSPDSGSRPDLQS